MRDVRDGLAQQRVRGHQPPIVLDVAPAHPGAKTNAAFANGNVAKSGNPAQIDQRARRRQPEGENRHQALSAGDDGRLGIRHEQVDCFPERGRDLVLEGSGFHPVASQRKIVANVERSRAIRQGRRRAFADIPSAMQISTR
jgi:hypothetical protein